MQKIVYTISSSTIKFKSYDLRNIPTSTGRADVLSRFIVTALLKPSPRPDSLNFHNYAGVQIFFNEEFISELSQHLNDIGKSDTYRKLENFSVLITPKSPFFVHINQTGKNFLSEHEILEIFYKSLEEITNDEFKYSLFTEVKFGNINASLTEWVKNGRKIYLLVEEGSFNVMDAEDFYFDCRKEDFVFIIGDQMGDHGISEGELEKQSSNINKISVGKQFQLASTVISLIKYKIKF